MLCLYGPVWVYIKDIVKKLHKCIAKIPMCIEETFAHEAQSISWYSLQDQHYKMLFNTKKQNLCYKNCKNNNFIST